MLMNLNELEPPHARPGHRGWRLPGTSRVYAKGCLWRGSCAIHNYFVLYHVGRRRATQDSVHDHFPPTAPRRFRDPPHRLATWTRRAAAALRRSTFFQPRSWSICVYCTPHLE